VVLVDTRVVACLLIDGDRTREAHARYARGADWNGEASMPVEFSNVLATCRRAGGFRRTHAVRLLAEAESRVRGLLSLPHSSALETAHRAR